jgi:hypothetical protein
LPFFQAHCIFFSKRKKKKKKRSTLHPEIKQWTNIGMANVTWNVAYRPGDRKAGTFSSPLYENLFQVPYPIPVPHLSIQSTWKLGEYGHGIL